MNKMLECVGGPWDGEMEPIPPFPWNFSIGDVVTLQPYAFCAGHYEIRRGCWVWVPDDEEDA